MVHFYLLVTQFDWPVDEHDGEGKESWKAAGMIVVFRLKLPRGSLPPYRDIIV